MVRLKRLVAIATALAMVAFLLAGCGSDDGDGGTGPEPVQPQIPPPSSFVMDFSDFNSGQPYEPLRGEDPVDGKESNANWSWAAGNVLLWNTIIMVGLAVPVASFLEAFNHEPTRQPDGTWIWDYNFMVDGIVHLAELHGRVVEETVQWEMYISKEGEYEDFLWYSGVSALDATEGTWTLFNNPTSATPFVGIEWHWYSQLETGDIKYTNIVPGGPDNGSYIFYGTFEEGTYNAFYDIYYVSLDNHTQIEWNRTTKAGRVSDPNHFGDSDWHCWDSNLQDVPCTSSQ